MKKLLITLLSSVSLYSCATKPDAMQTHISYFIKKEMQDSTKYEPLSFEVKDTVTAKDTLRECIKRHRSIEIDCDDNLEWYSTKREEVKKMGIFSGYMTALVDFKYDSVKQVKKYNELALKDAEMLFNDDKTTAIISYKIEHKYKGNPKDSIAKIIFYPSTKKVEKWIE